MVKARCPECDSDSIIANVEESITWKCRNEECEKEEFEEYDWVL